MTPKLNPKPSTIRKIVITSALPYGNGPLHIGHGVEYVQTDIWCRFMKLLGHQVTYICADDQHGSPIMLEAEKLDTTPEDMVTRVRNEHLRDFSSLGVDFDHYGATHCEENRLLCNEIYYALKDKGHIVPRMESQLYDPIKGIFLADRFVIGDCPSCKAKGQYGDNCEVCGAVYSPRELNNPTSRHSGATPVEKESLRHFFRLTNIQSFLKEWISYPGRTDTATRNKVLEWFNSDLRDWDISRDGPYFGFEIPDAPGKFFYVWLDAPIGYMAATKQWCQEHNKDFAAIWRDDGSPSDYERYHFIGKDIANFHCIFWPALLSEAGFRTPDAVFVHGFLTVNGGKMSKRKGTFITLETYLNHLPPECLRYYYATKLTPGPLDIDLNIDDFVTRVNGDLVGKVVNIAARTAPFIERYFDGFLAERIDDPNELMAEFTKVGSEIANDFEERRYGQGIRRIMGLADLSNSYIAQQSPWIIAKDEARLSELHQVCSLSINLFRTLMIFLSPVVPQLAERVWSFLNTPQPTWKQAYTFLTGCRIKHYERLMERIEASQVQAMVLESTIPDTTETPPQLKDPELSHQPLLPVCTLQNFNTLDLRVARITKATRVQGNTKITKLLVDIGDTCPRVVYAGVNGRYTITELEGRLTVVVANLPPKTFSFGVSEAMLVTAAGNGNHEIFLLSPDNGARPGMRLM